MVVNFISLCPLNKIATACVTCATRESQYGGCKTGSNVLRNDTSLRLTKLRKLFNLMVHRVK